MAGVLRHTAGVTRVDEQGIFLEPPEEEGDDSITHAPDRPPVVKEHELEDAEQLDDDDHDEDGEAGARDFGHPTARTLTHVSLAPVQRQQARFVLRRYLERAEANQPRVHYSQGRRLTSLGAPPSSEFWTDCSGEAISGFYWADMWCAFKVKDPGGYGYIGWGNTGSILATNRRRRVPLHHRFFIGDMALFGSGYDHTKHVITCRKGGTEATSIWSSHGSERGPYSVRLHSRSDLLVVVRAESLA